MNKKTLLYTEPTYRTYNYMAAFDVCGQNDPQMHEWIARRYILWKYNINENRIAIISSGVFGAIPFMYYHHMWKRHIKNNYQGIFKNLLDDDFYIFYSNVDDYYIPTTLSYGLRHFPHDGLIYGYDEERQIYCVCAYNSTGMYTTFEVPMNLFDRAWHSEYNKSREEMFSEGTIVGLRLDPNAGYKADISEIIKDIKKYVNSEIIDKNSDSVVFGLEVYKEINNRIEKTINGEEECDDKRLFKIISEHKLAMNKRFEYLYKNSIISSEMVDDYKKVYDLAENTRMLHLKYTLTNNKKILYSVKSNISKIAEKEYELLSKIK